MLSRALQLTGVLLLVGALPAAPSQQECPRIRVTDPLLMRALEEGEIRSPTFRALTDRIRRSNLIVHVAAHDQVNGSDGDLRFIVSAGGARFLRIRIRSGLTRAATIALLAHELMHAVEIADVPAVQSSVDLRSLYRRIGYGSRRRDGIEQFDSAAAVAAGRDVYFELAGRVPATTPGKRVFGR